MFELVPSLDINLKASNIKLRRLELIGIDAHKSTADEFIVEIKLSTQRFSKVPERQLQPGTHDPSLWREELPAEFAMPFQKV